PLTRTAMGSDTITEAFRQAIRDKRVKAILFRVDSPGGSAVASDVIWRETVRARQTGKPVSCRRARRLPSAVRSGTLLLLSSDAPVWLGPFSPERALFARLFGRVGLVRAVASGRQTLPRSVLCRVCSSTDRPIRCDTLS
ncbi:MAG: hypothetical protein ACRDTT_09640, partial [Pseudonocardiaceae bacterium]